MRKKLLVTAAIGLCGLFSVRGQQTDSKALMPAAQQNAMVQTYCAVCHTDASMNGGLSLEHFDAAHADPGEVAMMVGKLTTQALGASGQPLPDKATQDAFDRSLRAESAGAHEWTVSRVLAPKAKGATLTASVVREAVSAQYPEIPDLYRLKLTCNAETRHAEMQLAWSPQVPPKGQVMLTTADGKAPVEYKIDAIETYGNGMAGSSGPGSIVLHEAGLPKSLTISNLFPNETVEFPLSQLNLKVRQEMAACFSAGAKAGH